MRHASRPAYGLFQLLVLLAVLGMLVGMMLPAVAKLRYAAARMQSSNNLKQIGLASHSYHDTQNSFPAGVDDRNFSALFHLLPFLEQDELFKSVDVAKDCDDKANAKARSTRVRTFESPLDEVNETGPAGGTNYFAMAGSKMPLKDNDGVFCGGSATRIAGISDGLSNTVLFVEMLRGDGGKKAVSVDRQHVRLKEGDLQNLKEESGVKEFKAGKKVAGNRGSAWIDGRFLRATTNATRGLQAREPDVDCGGEGGLAGVRMHPDGSQVLLGDGSVRRLLPGVSLATWQAVATKAGGEVLGADW